MSSFFECHEFADTGKPCNSNVFESNESENTGQHREFSYCSKHARRKRKENLCNSYMFETHESKHKRQPMEFLHFRIL